MATEIIRGLYSLTTPLSGSVVTIGNFDGVHRGHQALLAQLNEHAKALNVPSVVVTFEPQPAEFFAQGQAKYARLTRWREKYVALAKYGVDKVLVLRFNDRLASLSAEEFIKNILIDGLAARHVLVGDDFRFGYQRRGDFDFLKNRGERNGFSVESMPTVLIAGERVSSTRIRTALMAANHRLAEQLLGRPYSLEGHIVNGDKRGRSMGFPTANVYMARQVTPVQGVYVVRMHGVSEQALPGVANIGIRPTVGGTRSLLEVHLFDFDQEIYGRHVSVEFCEKLRDEKRFDNFEQLKEQIWQDAAQARAYFMAATLKE